MTKLSVNLNKLALLRNQRDIGYPDLIDHAEIILSAGAQGLTIHPRPDERHIRFDDIKVISDFVAYKKDVEFNIEGYPSDDFIDRVLAYDCHQVTLVPDDPDQKTSNHGWDTKKHGDFLREVTTKLKEKNRRVSLFLDPDPDLVESANATGADRIELYTGPYAENEIPVEKYTKTAREAEKLGLEINAGHDLNLDNLAKFIEAVPQCAEVSIGHALTADALKMGWYAAVTSYMTAIQFGQKAAQENKAA